MTLLGVHYTEEERFCAVDVGQLVYSDHVVRPLFAGIVTYLHYNAELVERELSINFLSNRQ